VFTLWEKHARLTNYGRTGMKKDASYMDILYVAIVFLFFGLSAGMVWLFERL
jgi:hypothetical protein